MKQFSDYSDTRNKGGCTHCGARLDPEQASRDHVPSKTLLDRPLPDNLPVLPTCRSCNASFAKDEEYLSVFLAAVITGSVELNPNRFASAAASINHSRSLRGRIARAQRNRVSTTGEHEVLWEPEIERVLRVILKNARGHLLYELGEPVTESPSRIWSCPIDLLTPDERDAFEETPLGAGWPEVGSRMMQRVAGLAPLSDGWVEVQAGVYRYAVGEGPSLVRTVIREYLATEVVWE